MQSISEICKGIVNFIEAARTPIATIPPFLLLGAVKRPGLSPMLIASKIIQRQAEAGAPFGPAADGSQNVMEAMERIRVEEIIKAIQMDSRVQVAIPTGAIHVVATGENAGGPVVCTGFNVNIPHGDGIIG